MILIVLALALAPVVVVAAARLRAPKPSAERTWADDHAVAPRVEFRGDSAIIHGFRRFRHGPNGRFQPRWDTVAVDLTKIERVSFVLAPFGREWMGTAHSFVTFGLSDSTYIGISVEARRERGEAFSLWAGLTRRLELLYVIGDENDLIRQRVIGAGYDLYLFPVATDPEHARELFLAMLRRADALRTQPEYYDLIANNCTSNLIAHVNAIAPNRVPAGLATLLPGYADKVAEKVGLIAAEGDREALRTRFRVNEVVQRLPDNERFAQSLHEALGDTTGKLPRQPAASR